MEEYHVASIMGVLNIHYSGTDLRLVCQGKEERRKGERREKEGRRKGEGREKGRRAYQSDRHGR